MYDDRQLFISAATTNLSALAVIREAWNHRHLAWLFIMRDLRLRYKQTALGVIWAVIQPLSTALIFAVIFGQWVGIPTGGIPYFPLVLTGLMAWMFFSGSIQHATHSLVANATLITKAYFPRAVLPLASVGLHLVDLLITAVLLACVLVFYGQAITPRATTLLPALFVLCCLTAGLALIAASLSVYYRDFPNLIPIGLQLLMYASPVFYPSNLIPSAYLDWARLNPLVGVIDLMRWSLLVTGDFPIHFLYVSCPAAVILLLGGWWIFHRLEPEFSDQI
ncbi:MAG TPA: ABC transporter permease [Rhodocyclaceae bacterium]